MEKEEGEMSDDNSMLVDDVQDLARECEGSATNTTVLYKAQKNGLVIEQLEKIDAVKLEERAIRFGLDLTGNRVITQKQIDDLYANCGIERGNERHFRFDTLFMYGIDGLNTREIFEYLEAYKPVSLEWIDSASCNVVCQDHISAALALLVHSRDIKNDDLKTMLAEKSPYYWREGVPHPKVDLILMRFATNADKKMAMTKPVSKYSKDSDDHIMNLCSKNPWGDLCKSWGVYDHQEIFARKLPKHDSEDNIAGSDEVVQIKNQRLALRLGKRRLRSDESQDSDSESEWKTKIKTPRMRMHADDEESKQNKKKVLDSCNDINKNAYASLSIEVINSQSAYLPRETRILSEKFKTQHANNVNTTKDNIQSRLGVKVLHKEMEWLSDEDSCDDLSNHTLSRVHKVSNMQKNSSSVWSRLESKLNKSRSQSDLREMLKSRKEKKTDDLRERIGKHKRSNLRIQIDNKK